MIILSLLIFLRKYTNMSPPKMTSKIYIVTHLQLKYTSLTWARAVRLFPRTSWPPKLSPLDTLVTPTLTTMTTRRQPGAWSSSSPTWTTCMASTLTSWPRSWLPTWPRASVCANELVRRSLSPWNELGMAVAILLLQRMSSSQMKTSRCMRRASTTMTMKSRTTRTFGPGSTSSMRWLTRRRLSLSRATLRK